MYKTIFRYPVINLQRKLPVHASQKDISGGNNSHRQLNSETDLASSAHSAPPPFFRSAVVLVLAFACTGCGSLIPYRDSGIFAGSKFLLGLQSFIVGLAFSSLLSYFLYRVQIKKIKGWDITKHGDSVPSLSPWVLPAVPLFLVFLIFSLAIILYPYYLYVSNLFSHITGAFMGCGIGWWFVFRFYFCRKISRAV